MLLPFLFIRQLSRFGTVILLADALIVLGLFILMSRNVAEVLNHGVGPNIVHFDPIGYFQLLGIALYALEGTAFIIPIEHQMQQKSSFSRVAWISGLGVGTLYALFGFLGYTAHGDRVTAIATLNFSSRDPMILFVQAGYCIALFLSFPIAMFPALQIAESFIRQRIVIDPALSPSAKDRSQSDPFSYTAALRVGVALIAGLIATFAGSSFDNYVALVGGAICIPLTLIYPAYFHLRLCVSDGKARQQRFEDWICIIVGLIGSVACCIVSIARWNQGDSTVATCTLS
jgi:proton-coupled amino acid transporter